MSDIPGPFVRAYIDGYMAANPRADALDVYEKAITYMNLNGHPTSAMPDDLRTRIHKIAKDGNTPWESSNGTRANALQEIAALTLPTGPLPSPSSSVREPIRGLNCLLNAELPCDALREAREMLASQIEITNALREHCDAVEKSLIREYERQGVQPHEYHLRPRPEATLTSAIPEDEIAALRKDRASLNNMAGLLGKARRERDDARTALRTYFNAQIRMLERWADGDENVKTELWKSLHACEEPARVVLSAIDSERRDK